MKIVGIIPSRYYSTRLPGKPLLMIQGKTLLQRVYEKCIQSKKLLDTYIITDDERIYTHAQSFTNNILLSAKNHDTGTSRCIEGYMSLPEKDKFDGFVNIQGDEPLISPKLIDDIVQNILPDSITTAKFLCSNPQDFVNPNIVKVVCNNKGEAIYFSRCPIPYNAQNFYKHIGIYGFHKSVILQILLKAENNFFTENLEQLHWISKGLKINTILSSYLSHGVDTPSDVDKISQMLNVGYV